MATNFCSQDLARFPFFSCLPDAVLQALLDRHRLINVSAGQLLLMESDWGSNLMVIISGIAKVRSFGPAGEEIVLSILGAGDLVGEMSVVDGNPRSADITALSDVRILKLSGDVFMEQLECCSLMSLALTRLVAKRLREANRRLIMQKEDATTRVLDALACLAVKINGNDDPLSPIPDIPQGEIATIAGLARETSSRVVSKLRSRGVVINLNGSLRIASLEPLKKRCII